MELLEFAHVSPLVYQNCKLAIFAARCITMFQLS